MIWLCRGRPRPWLGCLLVIALLTVQAAGLSHQLRHGGLSSLAQAGGASQRDAWSPWTAADGHSCVLYDAASHGDGPPAAPALAVAGHGADTALSGAVVAQRPHVAVPRSFLSRAPPSMDLVS